MPLAKRSAMMFCTVSLPRKWSIRIDLVFLGAAQDGGVQRLGGGLVVAERLFDDHAAPVFRVPAVLVPVFLEQAGFAEMGDDRAEEAVGDGQVEQAVAAGVGFLVDVLLQLLVQAVVVEVALDVGDVAGQALPGVLIDLVDPAFAGGLADEAFHHLVQAVAPLVGIEVGEIDPDQLEVLRQQAGGGEVVQRRDQQAFGQVAAGAEDDHGAGAGRLRRSPGRGGQDLGGGLFACLSWLDMMNVRRVRVAYTLG